MRAGKKLHLLNGVTSERVIHDPSYRTGGIWGKISGGCERYFDWEEQRDREATASELLRYIRLGEALDEVGFVGNPLVMRYDEEGNRIDERIRRVKTAAMIAKNTRKLGSMDGSGR